MTYIEKIDLILKPSQESIYSVVDLFAGCGGLSLGFESNGFSTLGYDMNKDACATYNSNLSGVCFNESLTTNSNFPKADVLIGGPPCQPFSVIGNQRGLDDTRNGFPICLGAVKKIKPKIFLFENVRGLLFKNKWYLDQLVKELEALKYKVQVQLLNAKHFDVPQNRERIFIVGHKKGNFNFPEQKNYLVSAGNALGNLAFETPWDSKFLTRSMRQYIAKYEKASNCVTKRNLHLDRPARTLTCRNLGGSTGDMQRIKLPDGRVRRLTLEESAILQSFPKWFGFSGNETSVFNQIGNAVPPMMAYHLARSIKQYLNRTFREKKAMMANYAVMKAS